MNWLLKLLFSSSGEFLKGVVTLLTDFINNIFQFMYEINVELLNLDLINTYMIGLGLALVGFFGIKQGFQVYALYTDGDPDADPLELITRVSISIATIMCGGWLINELIKAAGYIAEDAVDSLEGLQSSGDSFADMVLKLITTLLASSKVESFVLLIFVIVMIVAFIIFIFQAAKRGAELMLFQLLISIMAVDLLTTNKERWNSFFTELIITIFGYIIQLICFKIFMVIFSGVVAVDDPVKAAKNVFLALAWLMLVISSPKWLQKFSYSSGVGNVAKGGLRNSTYLISSLIRK